MKSPAKHNFVKGAAIIAAANLLVKAIGAVFKIPLDRFILETDGMALYNSSYNIYNLLFVVSTAGLPVAISKLVAEATSKGNYKEAHRIFRVSMWLLAVLGSAGMLILSVGSHWISHLIGYDDAYLTMIVMAPSLLMVGCMSAFRGYFQGMQNMFPTAISEVCEALGKLCIGLSMAYLLLPKGKLYASAGAISGVTCGGFIALCFLFFYYLRTRRNLPHTNAVAESTSSTKELVKRILVIAVPITIGVSVFTLTSLIDTAMVSNQMAGYVQSSTFLSSAEQHLTAVQLDKFMAFSNVQQMVGFIYGYLGRAITMFNLPPTIIAAIAISVVPAIASANAVKNHAGAQSYTKSALRITILLALPCAVGMSVLAEPILGLVYGDGSYASLLNIMGLSVALVTLVQIANAILQAWSKVWIPVVNMLLGGIVKVVVNFILVSIPSVNINGAPIGTFLCYLTVVSLNLIAIKRCTGIKFGIIDFFVKPLVCAGIMGVAAVFCYRTCFNLLSSNLLALALSIVFAAIVYFVILLAVHGMKKEDVLLLPKGQKLAAILERVKLL